MNRKLFAVLGMTVCGMAAGGTASAQTALDALESDVMTADERIEEALARLSSREVPRSDAQRDLSPGHPKHKLRLDWQLDGLDGRPPLLAPMHGETLQVLEDIDERGHGHAWGLHKEHERAAAGDKDAGKGGGKEEAHDKNDEGKGKGDRGDDGKGDD